MLIIVTAPLTFFRFVITVFTKFSVMIERADVLVVIVLAPVTRVKFITNLGAVMLVAVETVLFQSKTISRHQILTTGHTKETLEDRVNHMIILES